jgi:hypothetical protein
VGLRAGLEVVAKKKIPCPCRESNDIKTDLREIGWEMWTGFIWLRIGSNGGLL